MLRGLTIKFLAIAAVSVISFALIFIFGQHVLLNLDAINLDHAQILALQRLQIVVEDAETGQRGYLLTGKDAYLQPFETAQSALPAAEARLQPFVDAKAISDDELQRINVSIGKKMAELSHTVTLGQSGHADEALAIVNGDSGKNLMDDLRGQIKVLLDRANADLADASLTMRGQTHWRNALFGAVAIFNLGFLAWAFVRLHHEQLEHRLAAAEVQRQKDLLSVTLASIGDAVIVTDEQGVINFVNPTAVNLTGWSPTEAAGQPCATVFNIINESTRERVESPVDKVLRLGTIVGLANHTLLIRKDGSEIPIDDSGAPIRDESGKIRGVVLIFRDFSEHKASERQLRQTNEALQLANNSKDQFLATLSHELRTPLTPVLATLSVWEGSTTLPPTMLSSVRMLRRNIELEARLIDDLLDLTRIAKGKMPIALELVDVNNLLENAIEMYHSDIRSKRIKIATRLGAADHHVSADPARLSQVFWNILKNATKFTPEGGTIDVSTENQRGGKLVIRVKDSGIGMTDELIGRLFKPFEQGEAPIVRRLGGLGLGMALARALLDAQNGEIEASSEGPGKGSTFTVTLRFVSTYASNAPLLPPSRFDFAAAKVDDARKLTILLVEDHADTAEVLQQVIRALGHKTAVAGTVKQGIELFDTEPFDFLISDIGLPDGTGLDLIRALRPKYNGPAIALTGFGMEDDVARCTAAGFDAHLVKPVDMRKLALSLQQVTRRVES